MLSTARTERPIKSPRWSSELGAEVIVLSDDPSGTNINLNCGALYPEELQKKVIETQADVGIAHDGDADRAVFVDERGHVVDGDALLVAFALALHQEKALKGETLVSTLMSNMGMDLASGRGDSGRSNPGRRSICARTDDKRRL